MAAHTHTLAVFGSRTLSDERVRVLLLQEIARTGATTITVAAEPHGVCEVARDLAAEVALPLLLHHLDHGKARGAWDHRSQATIRAADSAVLIWDGKSKGTANDLRLCVKWRLPHELHHLEPIEESAAAVDWGARLVGV